MTKNTHTQKRKKELLASDMVKEMACHFKAGNATMCWNYAGCGKPDGGETYSKMQFAPQQQQEIRVPAAIKQSTITSHYSYCQRMAIFYQRCVCHAVTWSFIFLLLQEKGHYVVQLFHSIAVPYLSSALLDWSKGPRLRPLHLSVTRCNKIRKNAPSE